MAQHTLPMDTAEALTWALKALRNWRTAFAHDIATFSERDYLRSVAANAAQ